MGIRHWSMEIQFNVHTPAFQAHSGHRRGAVAQKPVEHAIIFAGGGPKASDTDFCVRCLKLAWKMRQLDLLISLSI
jgi:hypothetical protein